jgi:hypothetical protein
LLGRSSANQDVIASTTLVNATNLGFSVAANEVWQATWYLIYNGTTGGDLKIGWTFPTGGTLDTAVVWSGTGGTLARDGAHDTTSPSATLALMGTGAIVGPLAVFVTYANGANAGTLQLQFAQFAASGTTTMVANSCVIGALIS